MKCTEYYINYDALTAVWDEFAKYAASGADYCSLMTYLLKPYSKRPPDCDHDEVLKPVSSFLVRQEAGIRKWANCGENNNHRVMNIYECRPGFGKRLREVGNLLNYHIDLPRDICFYRGKDIWISTITHESLAFIYDPVKTDLDFFEKNGAEVYKGHEYDKPPYRLKV